MLYCSTISRLPCESAPLSITHGATFATRLDQIIVDFVANFRILDCHLAGGIDPFLNESELENIRTLYEANSSYIMGNELHLVFKGIQHVFKSLREVAAAFNISLQQNGYVAPPPPQNSIGHNSIGINGVAARPRPPQLSSANAKPSTSHTVRDRVDAQPNGRVGSRFQNPKLVAALNEHIGLEVTCGELYAKLATADLSGLTFELTDSKGVGTGKRLSTAKFARSSNLAYQNNAWKSIKVYIPGSPVPHTLDYWITMIASSIADEGGEGSIKPVSAPVLRKRRTTNQRGSDESEDDEDDEDEWSEGDRKPRRKKRKSIPRTDEEDGHSLQPPGSLRNDTMEMLRLKTEENYLLQASIQSLEQALAKKNEECMRLTDQISRMGQGQGGDVIAAQAIKIHTLQTLIAKAQEMSMLLLGQLQSVPL